MKAIRTGLLLAGFLALAGCVGESVAPPALPTVSAAGTVADVKITGKLVVSSSNCIGLSGDTGTVTSLTWPKGYGVARAGGEWEVRDATGKARAKTGETVVLAGASVVVDRETPGCPGATSTLLVSPVN